MTFYVYCDYCGYLGEGCEIDDAYEIKEDHEEDTEGLHKTRIETTKQSFDLRGGE